MPKHSMKAPGQRQLRVGEEVRHVLVRLFERGAFKDPELFGRTVTVTEVRMTPDLKKAKVFVCPLGGEDMPGLMEALARCKSHLRYEVGQAVRLKYTPDLEFEPDTSFDSADYIEDLLASPEVKRDLDRPDDDEGASPKTESDNGA